MQVQALRQQGYSTARIQAEVRKKLNASPEYARTIAENTLEYKQNVIALIAAAEAEAVRNGNKLVAEAGDMSFKDDLRAWEQHNVDLKKPNNLDALYKAIGKQTADGFKNITKSTGFRNTVLGTTGVLDAYRRTLDLAVAKSATGAFSYTQAVKDVVTQLSKNGLRSIDYSNGRSYELDTAARMCVRTALGQLTGKIQEENMKNSDTPLVYVDAHAGARPEHAVWQGAVYLYKKPEGDKATVERLSRYPDFFRETDYGSVTGLMGVNCSHHFYPYWEGSAIPEFKEPDPIEINGKVYTYYEATQEMRKQERAIRATKREVEASAALGLDTKQLNAKLKAQRAEYKQFAAEAGINIRPSAIGVKVKDSDLRKTSAYKNSVGDKLRNPTPKGYVDTRSVGEYISYAELSKFTKRAADMGVRTNGFQEYRGDVKVLNEVLDQIERTRGLNLKKSEIILNYDNVLGYLETKGGKDYINRAVIDVDAFAETKGKVITLNKFMYDDSAFLKSQYDEAVKDNVFASGTTYINVIDHEIGHQYLRNNKALEQNVVDEVSRLAYNEGVEVKDYITANVSIYAGAQKDGGAFSELVPELNAQLNGSNPAFAEAVFTKVGALNEDR